MLRIILSFTLVFSTYYASIAQNMPLHSDTIELHEHEYKHVNNLKDWFHKGLTQGTLRLYSMFTVNEGSLSDYGATAVGGRLYFHTADLKGFQLGVGGIYTYNILSSDLGRHDELSDQLPTWERQLFDITDPENKSDLDRLEELFLRYKIRSLSITYGKQPINTPIANEQDGRMKPTALDGLWVDWKSSQITIKGGWFSKVSPRATTEWYSLSEAIGVYNTGVNPDGTKSQYKHHISSRGLLIVGSEAQLSERFKAHVWYYELANILRATFVQLDYRRDQFYIGFQSLIETQAGSGGNEAYAKKYFHDKDSYLLSGRAEYRQNQWKLSLNTTVSIGDGRFLFPRELGTVSLFTFVSRLRVEGLGRFSAHVLKLNYYPLNASNSLDIGLYLSRTITNPLPAFNKYGLLTNNQLNLDITYNFKESMEGLSIRLLGVGRASAPSDVQATKDVFYNSNLLHLNLIANYNF